MADETPDPEYLYGCLSERARLALLRNPQGFVPKEFIGQVMSVCGEASVCHVAADDDPVPHFAIFQGPVSDFLYDRRQDLDAWWGSLESEVRTRLVRGDVGFGSCLVERDYLTLRVSGAELQ